LSLLPLLLVIFTTYSDKFMYLQMFVSYQLYPAHVEVLFLDMDSQEWDASNLLMVVVVEMEIILGKLK